MNTPIISVGEKILNQNKVYSSWPCATSCDWGKGSLNTYIVHRIKLEPNFLSGPWWRTGLAKYCVIHKDTHGHIPQELWKKTAYQSGLAVAIFKHRVNKEYATTKGQTTEMDTQRSAGEFKRRQYIQQTTRKVKYFFQWTDNIITNCVLCNYNTLSLLVRFEAAVL